jgi:hypothetical protein
MAPLILHADNPDQVSSRTEIDADLGVGNRRLLVCSGIAIVDWRIDTDEVTPGEFQVMLKVFARSVEKASPFVGLASISNDETGFVFAVNMATVGVEPSTGELFLHAHTALMGEWSALNRVGYQVVATVVRVGAFIEGTISWPVSLYRPESEDTAPISGSIGVVANRHELIPNPVVGEQIFGPAQLEKLTPMTAGVIHSLTVEDRECKARYRIDNPPLGVPLKVTLTVSPQGVIPANTYWSQTSWPQVFTLSPTNPSEQVDFALGSSIVVN